MEQVHEYLKRCATPSPNLRKRLLSYYEAVLDFAIDAHREFTKSLSGMSCPISVGGTLKPLETIFGLMNRKVLSLLKRFYDKIRPIITDVNTAAQDDSLQGVHKVLATLKDHSRELYRLL